jgi:hypothetical protein
MKYRTTLRERTLDLIQWLREQPAGWKLQGRTNEIWQGGVRFWIDVRRIKCS